MRVNNIDRLRTENYSGKIIEPRSFLAAVHEEANKAKICCHDMPCCCPVPKPK